MPATGKNAYLGRWIVIGALSLAFLLAIGFAAKHFADSGEKARDRSAKQALARRGIMTLSDAVDAYKRTSGDYPPDLETLTKPSMDGKPAPLDRSQLLDPWGRPYNYEPANRHPVHGTPHVYTLGPDPSNPGDVIDNW